MKGVIMAKNVPVKVRVSEDSLSVSKLREDLQKMHMEMVCRILQSDQYSDPQADRILDHMQFLLQEESRKRMEKEGRSVGI